MSKFVHEVKNFLTKDDIKIINNTVFQMKSSWKTLDSYKKYENLKHFFSNKEKTLHVLGDAIYLLNDTDGKDEIDWNIQEQLKINFEWVYRKLFNVIKKEFGVDEVQFDDNLPVPAFHIFGEYQAENVKFPAHQDSEILNYYSDVVENDIRSFAALIQSPKDRPYLDITLGEDSEKNYYQYGSLHFWHGMIPHRIGPFSLEDGEYRITFQGHFYVDPNSGVVKVYF
jgi:hypothetical protein